MGEEVLLSERRGSIMLLTLNQPDMRNSISGEMNDALKRMCAELQQDMTVRCVLLTGAGSAFCAGGNIKNMRDRKGLFGHAVVETPQAFRDGVQGVPRAFLNLDVPVIAAINGAAVGAGLDFALMCDMRIASDAATFAESFIRVGLIPGDGGAWLLPRTVGMAAAMEMALTAEAIDASRALQLGIVSRVVAPSLLLETAFELAEKIARHSPQAVRMTKRLLRVSENLDLEKSLEMAAFMQSVLQSGTDHREAVAAVFENRAGTFTGK
jgi:enoyl-CoA hydratase/carnithine racemase